jgi:hypothetical protein
MAAPPLIASGQVNLSSPSSPEAEPLPPEVLFERLRDTPVTTPLFPSDLAGIVIVPWDDTGDDDLDGVIGGLLVHAGPGEDAPLIGVYIIHPTFVMAEERLSPDAFGDVTEFDVLGRTGVWQRETGDEFSEASTLLGVVEGVTIVSALAEGDDAGANDLRALSILSGLLDHLRLVTSPDGP